MILGLVPFELGPQEKIWGQALPQLDYPSEASILTLRVDCTKMATTNDAKIWILSGKVVLSSSFAWVKT